MSYKIQFKFLKDRSLVKIKGNSNIENRGRLRLSNVKISGEGNRLIIEEDARISKSNIWINGKNNIVKIGKNCDLNNLSIVMDNSHGLIEIGEETTCGKTQIVSLEPYDIKIGKNCMISYDVEIRNTDSHKILDKNTKIWVNKGKEVIIEDNVWIAMRSTVLKGSRIQKNSIIGSASIVSGNISENSIAAGNPAKVIKSEVEWNRESVVNN
ncbi:MAG: acyltransferase [Fusobacteriaceae bacterium]